MSLSTNSPNNLLDNPLIQKYFGSDSFGPLTPAGVACAILKAMQEPIKAGDRFLELCNYLPGDPAVLEQVAHDCDGFNFKEEFHPWLLRLPDAHQKQTKKECEPHMVKCEQCGYEASVHLPKMGETATFKWPEPAPEPEKCDCGKAPWQDHACTCLINGPRPSAVDEKIKSILRMRGLPFSEVSDALYELVRLAREEI